VPPTDETPRPSDRRRDPRNTIILLQSILVATLLAVVFRDHLPAFLTPASAQPEGEPVSVLDVVLDREGLRFLDVVFDRPLGEGRVGDVLGRDPAVLIPSAGGAWRWQGANILRLEPSGRFTPATEYRIELSAGRLLEPGQVFAGKSSFIVRTDQFQVERVDIFEEPGPAEIGGVTLRGDARFNYPVDPRVLATKMRLVDPERGEASPVPLEIETGWTARIISFRSESIVKKTSERELRLVILSDLTPAQGNVPLSADFVQKVLLGSSEVLALRSVEAIPGDPDSRIRLSFSSPVSAESAARYLKVSPDVKHRLSSDRNVLEMTGSFQPGAEYEVTLAGGCPGTDGSLLKETVTRQVKVPDLAPSAGFQSQGMFLSASGYRNVAVESVNVDHVELEIDRVYLNNLFALFEYHSYEVWSDNSWGFPGRHVGDVIAKETLRLPAERNKRAVTPLDLDQYVRGKGNGLYRVALSRPEEQGSRQRWLLITDMGIVAKVGREECTVWVASFGDLSQVAGARVRLISDQNQTIASGTTDAAGVWARTRTG